MASLTLSQKQALKADIIAKAQTVFNGSTFATLQSISRMDQIAAYYNDLASPQVDLWRPDLTIDAVTNNIVMSDFIALTTAKQQAWFAMSQAQFIDATIALVRTNFVSIFGNGTSTLTNVTAIAKKAATNLESLFTTSNVSAVYKQTVTADEIIDALRS